jgi:hypothetical protein
VLESLFQTIALSAQNQTTFVSQEQEHRTLGADKVLDG